MGKPTQEELAEALQEAARMREHRDDPHFLAKALLNMNYRLSHLEKVRSAAERYTRFGQGEHEHAELVKALASLRRAEERSAGSADEETVGLG